MSQSGRDLAGEWRLLQAEWEAASADYRLATAAGAAAEAGSDLRIEKAESRLAEIKQKMADVIAAGRVARGGRNSAERLVVTEVDLGGDASKDVDGAKEPAKP